MPAPFRLMLACCRWSYSGEGEAEIRALARQVDATQILAVARRHRVQGLVHDALARLDKPSAQELENDTRGIAGVNLRSALEIKALMAAFAEAGLPILVVKGLPLAAQVYPRPFLKMGADIDLLVDPQNLLAAGELLRSADYRCIVPARMELARWHRHQKESVWRRAGDGILVELHHALADQANVIPRIGMKSPTTQVRILPGLTLPTFSPPTQFAYLSVHGANSLWFRAKWLSDIAALLHRENDIGELYERAAEQGAGRPAALALALCRELFGTDLPAALNDVINAPAIRKLATAAIKLMIDPRGEPTERRWGTLPIHLAQLSLNPGPLALASEIKRQVLTTLYNRLA